MYVRTSHLGITTGSAGPQAPGHTLSEQSIAQQHRQLLALSRATPDQQSAITAQTEHSERSVSLLFL